MKQDPDIIRQFARFLAEKLRQEGRGDFEIRAYTSLSFNGREPQPLIDPDVDLAAPERPRRAADWLMPLADRP